MLIVLMLIDGALCKHTTKLISHTRHVSYPAVLTEAAGSDDGAFAYGGVTHTHTHKLHLSENCMGTMRKKAEYYKWLYICKSTYFPSASFIYLFIIGGYWSEYSEYTSISQMTMMLNTLCFLVHLQIMI